MQAKGTKAHCFSTAYFDSKTSRTEVMIYVCVSAFTLDYCDTVCV